MGTKFSHNDLHWLPLQLKSNNFRLMLSQYKCSTDVTSPWISLPHPGVARSTAPAPPSMPSATPLCTATPLISSTREFLYEIACYPSGCKMYLHSIVYLYFPYALPSLSPHPQFIQQQQQWWPPPSPQVPAVPRRPLPGAHSLQQCKQHHHCLRVHPL